MTNQVSISTATQGTGTTASKAQASDKGSGFLGMLMSAIGHKPKTDASGQAAGAANIAGLQVKHGHLEKHALLNGKVTHLDVGTDLAKGKSVLAVSTGGASAQAAKTGQGKADALAHAVSKATADSKVTAQAAKAKTSLEQATALADAATKVVADRGQQAATQGDGAQKGKAGHGAMAKPQTKDQHHPSKASSDDASGTANPAAAAMPQIAATVVAPQPAGHTGAQTAADAMDTQAQAQGRASAPMEGSAGKAALAAAAGMRTQAAPPVPTDAASEKAMAESAMATQAVSTSGSAKPAATQAMRDTGHATQATAEIATAGMQAEGRHHEKGTTQTTAKATATAGKGAASQDTGMGAGMRMTATHPQDIATADSHAGASENSGGPAARTPLPQAGIQSYNQVAGGQARPLPANATLLAHADRTAALRPDAMTASNATPGQDPTGGAMAMATPPGLGQSIQTTANPQTAMPQAPVHTSGPWTAMAAMAEIGQAAANGHSSLELKLEPAHLGKVHVRIDSDGHKNIQVHLVVEQAASRQAIEQQLPNLRHALEQQGLNLGNFSMSSQQQGGGQGSGQPGQQATMASIPSFHGTQASAPQMTSAPSEPSGAGRLSIRI